MKPFPPLFIGALLVSLAHAERPSTFQGNGAWSGLTQGLCCRATPERTEYALGDPVRVLIEVRNESDRPVALGLEPLTEIDKEGRLCRQPAEIGLTFSQGTPGFSATYSVTFPRGKGAEARAVAIEPNATFSEIVETTPWGPAYGSVPSTAQPGMMALKVTLRQFLSADLKKTEVDFPTVIFVVKAGARTSEPEGVANGRPPLSPTTNTTSSALGSCRCP